MATVTIPFPSFGNGDPIIASQHNSNWAAISTFVDGLAAGGNQFDPGAIDTALIADAAITNAKLADNSVTSAKIVDGTIVNADINATAGIVDTKLATIATAGKVSNSATTATNANTASAIVARDPSGNFSAGTITAALTGNVTGNVTGTASGNLVSGGALGTPSSGNLANCTFPTLNQNTTGSSGSTTGNAATATALHTARNIGGVSFDGTASINLPGVNTAGNQNTSGSSASCTGNAATATNASDSALLNGYASDFTGQANLVMRTDSNGVAAALKYGAGSTNTFNNFSNYSGTILFRANTAGNIYTQAIATSPRAMQCNADGTMGTIASSIRFKENLRPYTDHTNKILEIQPYIFDYKLESQDEDCSDPDGRLNQFGMIAEHLHDAGLNHLVHYGPEGRIDSINYMMLSVELIGVVKNQQTVLNDLISRITALESK